MAKRPIFLVTNEPPYYRCFYSTFQWNGGFAKSQKQKNIKALHESYTKLPVGNGKRLLEISSASPNDTGVALSAFNLKKYVPSLNKSVNLECVFQAGKIFENGGPYLDLLEKTSKEAKKDERIRNSGKIVGFEYEGKRYPNIPRTAFYDWLYINACLENIELVSKVLEYDGFTYIEFNPDKSSNCQARSLAMFDGIYKNRDMNCVQSFDDFVREIYK